MKYLQIMLLVEIFKQVECLVWFHLVTFPLRTVPDSIGREKYVLFLPLPVGLTSVFSFSTGMSNF